ncbi:hypothetical protein ACIBF1_12390 [Spirillospora sp. NPDC050679]
MTTDPHDEYGEILRRALSAEAETVDPSADGLQRIRARIDERRQRRFGWEWFTANWGRPVLAVGAAVAIAGIGVSAPQTMDLIQSAGNHGDSQKQERPAADGTLSERGGAPTGPQATQPSGRPSGGATSAVKPPVSVSAPGATVTCQPTGSPTGPADGTDTARPPARSPSGGECPTPTPTPTPTTSPSSPAPTTPAPTTTTPAPPTDPPTTPVESQVPASGP